MPKVNFIVPVYNSEKNLKICLDSIFSQTNNNYEVVIINDGSTDGSDSIIKEYIKLHPSKIDYVVKENTGIADTRNIGIERSRGEYIIFIDSDDYIATDLLEKLQQYIKEEPDLIKYKLTCVTQDLEEIEKVGGPVFKKKTGEDAFNSLYYQDKLMDSPCLYAMRREYLLEKGFKFAKGRYHEDFGLIPQIIVNAKEVISTDIYGYYYIQSENSIMRNADYKKTVKKLEDSFAHYDLMLKSIEKSDISDETKENMKIFYTNSILQKLKTLDKKEQKEYIGEFKKRKMTQNIKARNLKQSIKKLILKASISMYLKLK